LHPKDLQPSNPGGAAIRRGKIHSHQEAIHKLEREEGDFGRGSTTSKEAPQVEKKEDTVGRVTMINGAMG
jgi:hypothetical protein